MEGIVAVERDDEGGLYGYIIAGRRKTRRGANQKTNFTYRVSGWQAEHDDGRALVIVHQRPEIAGRVLDRPFRDDVLSRFRVALEKIKIFNNFQR